MSTMFSDRQDFDSAKSWSAWELARLFLHWVIACAAVVLIGTMFFLAQIFPSEMVPILVSAFALLGLGLASFCLWALAVGMQTVRRVFYGPWSRNRREKVSTPWFDRNGAMLWQRDGRGGWVRKVDVVSSNTTTGNSGAATSGPMG